MFNVGNNNLGMFDTDNSIFRKFTDMIDAFDVKQTVDKPTRPTITI